MDDLLLRRKKISRLILIIATVIFGLAIIPGVFVAMFSTMIFDSGMTNTLILLYSFISTFPLICFLSFISWIFYKFRKFGMAVFISLLPVFNIVGIIIVLILQRIGIL